MNYSQLFNVREGEVVRCFDAILYDALIEKGVIQKSAATKVSEYNISLTTLDSFSSYKNYAFSLNEMEATFSSRDNALIEIVLRDTSVHKKITLKDDKCTLVYAKGQDVVGKNSEVNDLTSKETIHSITINDKEFIAPLEDSFEDVYQHLTGINLSQAREQLDNPEDSSPINWWTAFINKEES